MGYIYQILNAVNNKCYIGQTSNKYPNTRWSAHKLATKNNIKRPLYNSMKKHGIDKFKFIIIDKVEPEKLNQKEIEYISTYNSKFPNGYNLTNGGECLLGENNPMFGKKPWNKGIPRTEKCKEKISIGNIGKVGLVGELNPMYGKSAWNRGIKLSEKEIYNCRKVQKGCKAVNMFKDNKCIKKFISIGEAGTWIRNNTKYVKADYATISKSIKNDWNCYGYKFRFGDKK